MTTTPVARDSESWFQRVERFFFAEEQPYALAAIRMLLPIALLIAAIPRWFHAREIFSADGSAAPLWVGYGYSASLMVFGPTLVVAAYTIMILCLITMSLGWRTRTSMLILLVLYPYFGMADTLGTLTKYTVITAHLLLLLCLSGSHKVWSLDAWLAKYTPEQSASPVWPRRLIQLLVAIVYLGASVTKLKMPEYLSGDQVRYWMLTNTNFPNPLGEMMSQYPAAIAVMSYVTVIWEILFPFLCWKGTSRNIMLGLGLVFHALTYFMLGLIVFPLVYFALYLAFLEPDEVSWLGRKVYAGWCRLTSLLNLGTASKGDEAAAVSWGGWVSPALFAGVLCVSALIGVTAEARMDVYGERRAEGRYVLQPISPEREAELFPESINLRLVDKVFDFGIGSTLLANQIADHRTSFRHGEQLVAQCTLTAPHEDLWLEMNLHDAHGLQLDRFGAVAPREQPRINAFYTLTDSLAPGEYAIVLKLHGREVMRRHFQLLAD